MPFSTATNSEKSMKVIYFALTAITLVAGKSLRPPIPSEVSSIFVFFSFYLSSAIISHTQRDLQAVDCTEEFLEAQGAETRFFPPVRDMVGFADGPIEDAKYFGVVDYLGYMNDVVKSACPEKDLGTRVQAKCKRTIMDEDNYMYSITVNTKKANLYMFTIPDYGTGCPEEECGTDRARYGVRADIDPAEGGICFDDTNVALANVHLGYKFFLGKGEDIPDLTNLELENKIKIVATANARGEQGRAKIQQVFFGGNWTLEIVKYPDTPE